MPGSPVSVGPFVGGLNLNEEPSSIADDQMSVCTNFDIGRAGELTVRPGLKTAGTLGTGGVLLGTVRKGTGYRTYARIASQLYYTDNAGTSWTAFGSGISGYPMAVIQYVKDAVDTTVPAVFVIPRGTTAGATATAGTRQLLSDNTIANVTGMPNGSAGTIYRERLFIYGQQSEGGPGSYRVWYSAARDFNTYGGNNFIDVGPGDGEYVTNISIQNDSLIIFKENSSWIFTFESDPAQGVLRKFNNEIGATGPNSVVTFENQLYIIDQRHIFRLINLLFEEISTAINIGKHRTSTAIAGNDAAVALGTRILFLISDTSTTFRYFVYHTELNSWSEYSFPVVVNKFMTSGQTVSETFLATATTGTQVYVYKPYTLSAADWGDYPTNTTTAQFASKEFKYDTPTAFKRLYWWAMEISGSSGSVATNVVTDGTAGPQNVIAPATTSPRVYKNFVQNRFRRVQFTAICTGTPKLTIHNIRAFVNMKAKVTSGSTA